MEQIPIKTMVQLKQAKYKSGGPVQGYIWAHIHSDYYVMEITGPHIAFYVEGINNLTVSRLVIHKDSIEF